LLYKKDDFEFFVIDLKHWQVKLKQAELMLVK